VWLPIRGQTPQPFYPPASSWLLFFFPYLLLRIPNVQVPGPSSKARIAWRGLAEVLPGPLELCLSWAIDSPSHRSGDMTEFQTGFDGSLSSCHQETLRNGCFPAVELQFSRRGAILRERMSVEDFPLYFILNFVFFDISLPLQLSPLLPFSALRMAFARRSD